MYGPLVLPEGIGLATTAAPRTPAGANRLAGSTPARALAGVNRPVDPAPAADEWTDTPEAVARAATAVGARFAFTGGFRRPDWKLELTLRVWEVTAGKATLVAEKTERTDFANTFDLMDRLALGLLEKIGRPAPPAVAARIRRPPTKDFYSFTLYGRGVMALHGLGRAPDLAKAEKDLSRAVFIDPKFAEAHRMLAVLQDRQGQGAKASGQRTYALDLRPDYYAPLAGLVKSAYDAKDRDEGIELATRALAIRPWDVDVRYLLGEMLWEEGRIDDSFVELKRLIAVRPDHLAARRTLVLILATKGASDELATELEQIIRFDPTDEAAKLDLGAAYAALGRTGDAIVIYEAVAVKNPKQVLALKLLGDMYRSRGDLVGAIGYYERALAANRNDPRPYFLLGSAYAASGQERKAIRIYQLAQRFPRYLAEVYNNLGALYFKRGDGQALWYLKQAAVRRPSNPRMHYNYALALDQARKRDQALAQIDLASQLDPADVDIQFERGVLLLKVGRLEEAEKAFAECARLDPTHENALHNLRLIDELRRRAREGEIQTE